MNKKPTLFCFSSFCLGLITYLFQKCNIPLPKLINNYLNDFLIIPIVLFVCLLVLQKIKSDKTFTLSLGIILYVCFLYSLLFEFVFPKYLARYTKDIVDVFLYFAGGFTFYFLQKQTHWTKLKKYQTKPQQEFTTPLFILKKI